LPGCEVCEAPAQCCDPEAEPVTLEGAHCCADGTWALDIGNGDPGVCDPAGGVGEVCEAQQQCCDPDDEPVTLEGAHCCADGTWADDLGNGDPSLCDARGGVGNVCA
jgi:hypothetical protein